MTVPGTVTHPTISGLMACSAAKKNPDGCPPAHPQAFRQARVPAHIRNPPADTPNTARQAYTQKNTNTAQKNTNSTFSSMFFFPFFPFGRLPLGLLFMGSRSWIFKVSILAARRKMCFFAHLGGPPSFSGIVAWPYAPGKATFGLLLLQRHLTGLLPYPAVPACVCLPYIVGDP